jgi:hypothetical protein
MANEITDRCLQPMGIGWFLMREVPAACDGDRSLCYDSCGSNSRVNAITEIILEADLG